MPSNYTQNYKLNQWEPEDRVLRADFNADNAKIDGAISTVEKKADALAVSKADQAALEEEIAARKAADGALSATLSSHAESITKLGNCQIYHLWYTGVGEGNQQSLTFPEKPIMVFLVQSSGGIALCAYGAMVRTLGYSTDLSFSIAWSENTMRWSSSAMNTKNASYQAIALCGRS